MPAAESAVRSVVSGSQGLRWVLILPGPWMDGTASTTLVGRGGFRDKVLFWDLQLGSHMWAFHQVPRQVWPLLGH